jgi:predicted RNA-binding Zn-ribbon protein involved in translation (DUF1610 family)
VRLNAVGDISAEGWGCGVRPLALCFTITGNDTWASVAERGFCTPACNEGGCVPHREFDASTNEVICPVCGRAMILLHTIRRAFAENLFVFKCKPCGFSVTEQ